MHALRVQGQSLSLVLRTPDERVDVIRVGLARGTAEIGVDRFRTELGRRDRERDVILAGGLALAYPAGTDLGALRHDAVVRLVRRHLLADGQDGDLGTDREGAELALVATVVALRHGSDGSHVNSPL